MKVTVLFASPRKNGVTADVLASFLGAFPDNTDIRLFDCFDLAPKSCTGCGQCEKTGRCFERDLDELFAAAEDCDVLAVATPVYNYSVPAPLKAIYDRCQPYYYKNFTGYDMQTNPNRKGFLFITAGRSGKDAFDIIKKQTGIFFKNLDITYTCGRFFPGTDAAGFDRSLCRADDIVQVLLEGARV